MLGASPAALKGLTEYGWPGNIRELRNAVERAMLLAEGDVARAVALPGARRAARRPTRRSRCRPRASTSTRSSAALVVQALERCGGNQTHAARLLGLNRDQIRYRIEKFNLTKATP